MRVEVARPEAHDRGRDLDQLAKLEMLRPSRLSVTPVQEEEWRALLEMAAGLNPQLAG